MNSPHTFRKLVFLVALAAGSAYGWRNYRAKLFPLDPLYQEPYIVLYGRDGCEYCQAMRGALEAEHVSYVYKRLEEPPVLSELEPRMSYAGLNTLAYDLPVIDVNAQLFERPSPSLVLERYNAGRGR